LKAAKKAEACVRIEFPDEGCAYGVYEALKPEALKMVTLRSRVKVELEKNTLIMHFTAADSVALRASMNSYLRWALNLKNCYEALK